MNANSRIAVVLSATTLVVTAPGCAGGKDKLPSENTTAVSGSVDGFGFGARVSAIAGTFWGADDGLDVLVTDTDDPCDALINHRRQPNTSVLVLGFLDAAGAAKLDTTSVAHSGAYQFADQPLGPGRWFRIIRAYHLDGACAGTAPGSATAGGGSLTRDVPLSGGTAAGQFSAQFDTGLLKGDFAAPFCQAQVGPTGSGCDYFQAVGGDPLSQCTCGAAP